MSGWGKPPNPFPKPPNPSPSVMVAITARGSDSKPLIGAKSTLRIDGVAAVFVSTADSSGRVTFTIPRANLGHGGSMMVTIDAYKTREDRILLPPDPAQGIRVMNAAAWAEPTVEGAYRVADQEFICQIVPVNTLRPLCVNAHVLETDDGQPWTGIGCTDFRVLQRFLAGEDIEPLLAHRAALGFNELRVFLMCHGMFHLYPQEIPNYQIRLRQFLDRLGAHNLRAELTVLVDVTKVMPDLSQQQRFFVEVCATVSGLPHVKLELVNEIEQAINVTNPDAFSMPSGICCHGSKGEVDAAVEAVCVTPVWTYGVLHPKRDASWPRYGHNIDDDIWQHLRVPGFINESCRPDQGRGPITSDFFDAAGNIAVMGAGGTFHSNQGKDSVIFSGPELDCAIAWVSGARAVPLWCQHGAYTAGHLGGYPVAWAEGDSVRAHGRISGNRAVLSLPQMRDGYVPVGVDGWRITKQTGSVVECER